MGLAAGQFVRRQHGNNVVHPRNGSQRLGADFFLIANDADDRAIGSPAEMGPQSERFDPLNNVTDLIVGHLRFENDDHGWGGQKA